MNKTHILYLITLLVFPIIGYIMSRYIELEKSKAFLKWASTIFSIHNILFYFGYSFRGEFTDYLVFSLEYLVFSFAVCILYEPVNIILQIIRTIGTIVLVIGATSAFAATVYILPVDFEAERVYDFTHESTNYQTRQHNTGSATSLSYSAFETYRLLKYFPFEQLVNDSGFQEDESPINCMDKNLSICIRTHDTIKMLEFSINGKTLYSIAIN